MPSSARSSSTSARVTPSRHPDDAGRCAHAAVAHDEHVRAGGLAQLVAGVGEDRLAGAALVRVRERAHVLRVRDRLQPRGRAALVARPRHDHDADRSGHGATRPRSRRRSRSGRVSPRSEPSGGTPPVTVMRSRASASPLARSTASAAARSSSRSGTGEAEPGRRVREPVEVAGPRERVAAVDADGLEHAVADEQPVVERRDARRVGRRRARRRPTRERGIDDAHRASALAPAHREQPRRLELGLGPLGVGSESATMPPPTPSASPCRSCRAR